MRPGMRAIASAIGMAALLVGLANPAAAQGNSGKNKDKVDVVLTAPSSGALYLAPAAVQLTAAASAKQKNHPIAKVEFFAGATLVGTVQRPVATGQYAFAWTGVAPGTYTLVARATNDKGDTDVSAPVAITVDAAPTVALASPAAGAKFNAPASIALRANAADVDGAVARVDFFQNGAFIGSAGAAPFNFDWTNVAPGRYSVTAVATDDRGASTTSAAVAVSVNALPVVSISAPADGAVYLAPGTVAVTASASDPDGTIVEVDFFQGGTFIGTATQAPYTATLANLGSGTYQITAVATDDFGATTTSSAISVRVNAAPTVSLTKPANGESFTAPANIVVAANAADDGTIAKVEFFRGGISIATLTEPPYSFTLTGVPTGSYLLTAVITDDLGASTTSDPVSVTVKSGVAQMYYIMTDHLNTPRLIQDQNRNAVWRWDQTEPFGDSVPDEDPDGDGIQLEFPLRFPGQYFDNETNLAYNYFREYDAAVGRYTRADPIGLLKILRLNHLYAYANGTPLNVSDRTGLFAPPLHTDITLTSFNGMGFSGAFAWEVTKEVVDFDFEDTQSIDQAHVHGMTPEGGDPLKARQATDSFIDYQTRLCTPKGLGWALHAGQDKHAGGHAGQQSFGGLFGFDMIFHYYDDWFPSKDQKDAAIAESRRIIEKYKRLCAKDCR
jgi:RHS repeat-associated protein